MTCNPKKSFRCFISVNLFFDVDCLTLTNSLLDYEIYRFLLHDYLHWVGRGVDIRERMAVDADRCVLRNFYRDIVASVWKNHLVVQDFAT